jgi:hypothetical protein
MFQRTWLDLCVNILSSLRESMNESTQKNAAPTNGPRRMLPACLSIHSTQIYSRLTIPCKLQLILMNSTQVLPWQFVGLVSYNACIYITLSIIFVFTSLHPNPVYNFTPSLINILILAFFLWLRLPVGSSVDVLQQTFVLVSCLLYVCYMLLASHPSWINCLIKIRQTAKNVLLFFILFLIFSVILSSHLLFHVIYVNTWAGIAQSV